MLDETTASTTISAPIESSTEAGMVGRERWEEIRRMFFEDHLAIAEIARRLQIDAKP